MSRIGKQPVVIPSGVDITIDGQDVIVQGPRGTLRHTVAAPITIGATDGEVTVNRPDDQRESRSLHGLTRTLIANMVQGVTTGYEKKLEIIGTGYRVLARGQNLEFTLGYSHSISIEAPEGIAFVVDGPGKVAVQGIDKQQVGQVAANIRKLRKPDPYKGKGVRYEGERIRRKAGKAGR